MHSVPAALRRGYTHEVPFSAWFFDNDGSKLTRTMVAGTSRQDMTISVWIKRADSVDSAIFTTDNGSNRDARLEIDNDKIRLYSRADGGGSSAHEWHTSVTYQSNAEWMHILVQLQANAAAASDRQKLWVDGVQITSFTKSDTLVQNENWGYNQAGLHTVGGNSEGTDTSDLYMADFVFLDGQLVGPEFFGVDFDGTWLPIDITGLSFAGTNSFYLNYADSAFIGKDVSGNANHFTTNDMTSANIVTDTPTNNSSLINSFFGVASYRSGARLVQRGSINNKSTRSNLNPVSGKWYAEVAVTSGSSARVGIMPLSASYDSSLGNQTGAIGYRTNGDVYTSGSVTAYGSSFGAGQVIGMALDLDSKTLEYFVNNVSQGLVSTPNILTEGYGFGSSEGNTSDSFFYHFNEDELIYTPPTGFLPVMSKYLP